MFECVDLPKILAVVLFGLSDKLVEILVNFIFQLFWQQVAVADWQRLLGEKWMLQCLVGGQPLFGV